MTNYVATSIPSAIIKTMITTNWDTYEGVLPAPTVVDINEATDRQLRRDLWLGDHILIRVDTPAEEETPIGNWVYGNRITRVLLEVYSKKNRQRLYDIASEIRRICHNQMHSLTQYQRIQYRTFNEMTQENLNIWEGRVILELVNNAVLLGT